MLSVHVVQKQGCTRKTWQKCRSKVKPTSLCRSWSSSADTVLLNWAAYEHVCWQRFSSSNRAASMLRASGDRVRRPSKLRIVEHRNVTWKGRVAKLAFCPNVVISDSRRQTQQRLYLAGALVVSGHHGASLSDGHLKVLQDRRQCWVGSTGPL